jgi:hypothetical protein
MGMGMAQQMVQAFAPGGAGAAAPGYAAGGPPPPPPAVLWHVANNGQTFGPFTLQQLAQAIAQGQLTSVTSVWNAGLPGWLPAGQLPELAALFGKAGPPPPPPPPA